MFSLLVTSPELQVSSTVAVAAAPPTRTRTCSPVFSVFRGYGGVCLELELEQQLKGPTGQGWLQMLSRGVSVGPRILGTPLPIPEPSGAGAILTAPLPLPPPPRDWLVLKSLMCKIIPGTLIRSSGWGLDYF